MSHFATSPFLFCEFMHIMFPQKEMVRALLVLIVSVSGMPPEQKQTSYSLEAGAPREPCDDGDDGGDDGEDFTPGWVY
jgi:hypothetical protein